MGNPLSSISNPGENNRSVYRSDETEPPPPASASASASASGANFRALSPEEKLIAIEKSMIAGLETTREKDEAHEIVDMLELAASSPEGSASAIRSSHGVTAEIATRLHRHLELAGGSALTPDERRIGVLSFIGKVINNEFESDAARWAVNFTLVSIRTGLSTWAITALRQRMAARIQHSLMNSDIHPTAVAALSVSAMLLGPVLNIIGAVVDERNAVATPQSRAGHGTMLLLYTAAAGLSMKSTYQIPFAASSIAVASYCLLRDLVNSQVRLENNAGEIRPSPTTQAALAYGAAQLAGGEAMDYYAADSGVGAVKASGLAMPNTSANDMKRGGINAMVEICDDLVSPALSRRAKVKHNRENIPADQLTQAHIEGLRIVMKFGYQGRSVQEHLEATCRQFRKTGAFRLSAFLAVNALAFALDTAIGESLDQESKGHLMDAVVALSIFCIYPVFAAGHDTRAPSAAPVATNIHHLQPA